VLAEDDQEDGDGDCAQKGGEELERGGRVGAEDGGEEGRKETQEGHVGDVAGRFGGAAWEGEVVGCEYVLGDPKLGEAVDVVG